MKTVPEILRNGDPKELRALFSFSAKSTSTEDIRRRYILWSRYYFPKYFIDQQTGKGVKDSPDHELMDRNTIDVYCGRADAYVDIGYRGLAKTTRKKLFMAFAICCDEDHFRKSMKVLSEDGDNSKQSVTDVYNSLISPRIKASWPEIFEKTDQKREETMSSFTTATGVKVSSGTVGMSQRGDLQEESRPDWVWFDDFETRIILRSAAKLKMIWDNMEEARNGLAKGGGAVYTCNYLSERGNVHKLVLKKSDTFRVSIASIADDDFNPTWPSRYTREDVMKIAREAEDYPGEFLSRPSASKDVLFNRARLDAMKPAPILREFAGMRIYGNYDPTHRYAGAADVAGGVGLDSSASCFIDFDVFPARVVAAYDDNSVHPEAFGQLLAQQGAEFGKCLLAPENNKFDAAIGRLKLVYPAERIYRTEPKEAKAVNGVIMRRDYGWNTNFVTKDTMMFGIIKAVNDGHLELSDPKLIAEARSYTRDDLLDPDVDPRLTTRHFDLLTAAAICWQMKKHARVYAIEDDSYDESAWMDEEKPLYPDIGI